MIHSYLRAIFSKALLLALIAFNSPVNADILTGNYLFNFPAKPVGLNLSIDTMTNIVDIVMTGRNDGWFAIGFGNFEMDGTYAIVIDNNGLAHEYQLGTFGANTPLTSTTSPISNDVVGSNRTVHVQRSRVGMSGDYLTFPTSPVEFELAGATGPVFFSQHSERGGTEPGSPGNYPPFFLTSVPEPSSMFLVVASVGACLFNRRRR